MKNRNITYKIQSSLLQKESVSSHVFGIFSVVYLSQSLLALIEELSSGSNAITYVDSPQVEVSSPVDLCRASRIVILPNAQFNPQVVYQDESTRTASNHSKEIRKMVLR